MSERVDTADHPAWAERTTLLLGLGGFLGLAVHLLVRGTEPWSWTDHPVRIAAAAFVAVGGIVFAFSLERVRWAWSVAFAAAAGLVSGFVVYWNGAPDDWGAGEGWQFFSALLAIAIAVPLFQAVRDQGSRRFPVAAPHAHVWSNLILAAAAGAFVGASFLLTFLLSELFHLIGVDLIRDLLRKGWFPPMLAGGALGAAVGILRDRDSVLGALQRVVRAVLSFLAPVLALGLVLFVLALPFTGLEPLWSQTKATTPILLLCIAGAFALANAAIGNGADEEPKARPLRWAAAALAAVMLPLALVAAVSTAKRIGQYGYTPDRLWAAVFVAVALGAGAAYVFALVRGRAAWPEQLRKANVRVAAATCLLALFLALPIVSFGAISARDQVARLTSGKVPPEKFDWAALRFDFGPAGRAALKRLQADRNREVARRAIHAAAAQSRWDARSQEQRDETAAVHMAPRVRLLPAGAALPPQLAYLIGEGYQCNNETRCTLYFPPSGREAFLFDDRCFATDPKDYQPGGCGPMHYVVENGRWEAQGETADDTRRAAAAAGYRAGAIELRTVTRRQAFVGGVPVGAAFE